MTEKKCDSANIEIYLDNLVLIERTCWAGGVAPVVNHLPSKCEALSSKPSTAKTERMRERERKKERERERERERELILFVVT
jgi:hypothetical protein